MNVIGKMVKRMEKVLLTIVTATNMMVNGRSLVKWKRHLLLW